MIEIRISKRIWGDSPESLASIRNHILSGKPFLAKCPNCEEGPVLGRCTSRDGTEGLYCVGCGKVHPLPGDEIHLFNVFFD
jgi:hypothetical protein